jgi:CheY-like chemotaxis protein
VGLFWPYCGQKVDTKVVSLTRAQFQEHLRDTLNHLYNPDRLRSSPLAVLFGVANRYDTPLALRRIVTESIDLLEPESHGPPQLHAWRMYNSLLYRYVEQWSQTEVADQLSISTRQLRREQHAALDMLADLLWSKYNLGGRSDQDLAAPSSIKGPSFDRAALHHELAWLRDASQQSPTDLDHTWPAIMDLANKLAAEHDTRLAVTLDDALPRLAVHPVALRPIVLALLSVAIPRASGGQVNVSVQARRWEVAIRVWCSEYPSGPKPTLEDEATSLDTAQQLAGICDGRLDLSVDVRAFEATLTLPALEQLPVLVIDDNADTLQLLQRYAAGTRYRLITTRDPEQALDLSEKLAPQIIVLDVMMPQVDGWEVLGRLRQHPITEHLPIIVYTILSQRDLALLLGASAFIHKPVTRHAFLAALDQQIEQLGSGSH